MAMKDKKACEGLNSDTVVLVICPLRSIIQDQVREGKSIGLDCVALHDLTNVTCIGLQIIFASAKEALDKDFLRILKDQSSMLHGAVELIVVDESHTVESWMGKWYVMIF